MTTAFPSLDVLVARSRPGLQCVLNAADALYRRLVTAEYEASFAPPVTHSAHCPCGSVMEIRGVLDDEDYDAIRDWGYDHADCEDDR